MPCGKIPQLWQTSPLSLNCPQCELNHTLARVRIASKVICAQRAIASWRPSLLRRYGSRQRFQDVALLLASCARIAGRQMGNSMGTTVALALARNFNLFMKAQSVQRCFIARHASEWLTKGANMGRGIENEGRPSHYNTSDTPHVKGPNDSY